MTDALDRAKSGLGGASGLAKALSSAGRAITSQAVSQWRRVPAERVIEVEKVTGVDRADLRPDLYPPVCTAPTQAEGATR